MSGGPSSPAHSYAKYIKKASKLFELDAFFMYFYELINFIVTYDKLKITIHYHTYAFRSILEKNVTIKIKTIAPNNAGRIKMPPHSGPQ